MTNREKLQSMAIYDLLVRMQDHQESAAVDERYDCVIDLITGYYNSCRLGCSWANCKSCIADWLNEEVRNA